MTQEHRAAEWFDSGGVRHAGALLDTVKSFDVIDCEYCGFKHVTPLPTTEELTDVYRHQYYATEKPLFLERQNEDRAWWRVVHNGRYEVLEQHLPAARRELLDIGSGPGLFLLRGKERGWDVTGIEPSLLAFEHSQELGLRVHNDFYSAKSAPSLGHFDVINMSEVLEHLPDPISMISLAHEQLNDDGLICIAVPNDFNPLQTALVEHHGYKRWWVAPPHHLNFFDFASMESLLQRHGFEVVHKESTFPIDMFLHMGDNYIGNDSLGRACHGKRKNFELSLDQAGLSGLMRELYVKFAEVGIGREVVVFARKV